MNYSSLVLFSGGKDSFITACMEVEQGLANTRDYVVHLISFNGGAMVAEENLLHGAARLQNRYGLDRIVYDGIYNTSSVIARLNRQWMYLTQQELGEMYSDMTNCQFQCLHCQSAMWICAIAYAISHNIHRIVAGNRASDPFCTGMKRFMDVMKEHGEKHHIVIDLPVFDKTDWDECSGWARDNEMLLRDFNPYVLEPKCLIGSAPKFGLSYAERSSMMEYFTEHIQPKIDELIDQMILIFNSIKLSSKSFDDRCYTELPKEENGIY